jgi:hypothetical protein
MSLSLEQELPVIIFNPACDSTELYFASEAMELIVSGVERLQ